MILLVLTIYTLWIFIIGTLTGYRELLFPNDFFIFVYVFSVICVLLETIYNEFNEFFNYMLKK